MFSLKSIQLSHALLKSRVAARGSIRNLHDIGSPMAHSHPHLVRPNQLVPGFTPTEFATRRERVLKNLPQNSAIVIPSLPEAIMSNDVHFPYRPSSDLYYLTGFSEPESLAVLRSQTQQQDYFSLYVRERNALREQWDGARAGTQAAQSLFAAHHISDSTLTEKCIDELAILLAQNEVVFFDVNANPMWTSRMKTAAAKAGKDFDKTVRPLGTLIAQHRALKSSSELQAMRDAAEVSAQGFVHMMRHTRPLMTERELAIEFEYFCAKRGAVRQAYPSIVASGHNALVLHYNSNNHIMRDGDLVLVDAGCERLMYASDITRTYPVNGRFSPAQRDVYQAVLQVQTNSIQRCKADGKTTLASLQEFATRELVDALIQLRVLQGVSVDEAIEAGKPQPVTNFSTSASATHAASVAASQHQPPTFKLYWPHGISHYLGMDVHDTSSLGKDYLLQPNMVITVEPGLYLPVSPHVPEHFHNIGIRIEDDVVIGSSGPAEVLTRSAPKSVDEIEAIMQQ